MLLHIVVIWYSVIERQCSIDCSPLHYILHFIWYLLQGRRWPEGVLTVLRLPPGLLAVRLEGGDHVLYAVVDGVVHRVVRPARVTVETLLLVLRQRRRRLKPQCGREITVMRADTQMLNTVWPADDWRCSSAPSSSCRMWTRPSGSSLVPPAGPPLPGNSCRGHSRGRGRAPGRRRRRPRLEEEEGGQEVIIRTGRSSAS